MSVCATADRTARWRPPGPPRSTIRRTVAVTVASLCSLALLALPALAAATIAPAEVTADSDVALTVTVTEPDAESHPDYGESARVVVTAPSGFTNLACAGSPFGWDCVPAEDADRVTFQRQPLVPPSGAASREFGITVHSPTVNGTYHFTVTQADGPPPAEGEDPPDTVTTRPTIVVTGGQEPEPDPSPSPRSSGNSTGGEGSTGDEGSTSGGDKTDGDSGDGGATSSAPSPEPSPTGTGAGDGDSTGADSGDEGATGSTAPRRTQGRASGTTLEISPGEPTGDDPAIAPPDVADDPAVAPPDDGASDADASTAVAAGGAGPGQGASGGPPWQQVVGAALLLVGGAVVAIRRWDLVDRLGGLEALAQLRRWRSG